MDRLYSLYAIDWRLLEPKQMNRRRAAYKVENFCDFADETQIGDQVLVADADLYFMGDPFKAFDDSFDLGLTLRGYEHWAPINGGVIYYRISRNIRRFLTHHKREVLHPDLPAYIAYRKKHNHERFGLDWSVGQDFLNVCWDVKNHCEDEFDIKIAGLLNIYNFCPAVDLVGEEQAKAQILRAYHTKAVTTLHLKSDLKSLIYDNVFEDAITTYPRPLDADLKWKLSGRGKLRIGLIYNCNDKGITGNHWKRNNHRFFREELPSRTDLVEWFEFPSHFDGRVMDCADLNKYNLDIAIIWSIFPRNLEDVGIINVDKLTNCVKITRAPDAWMIDAEWNARAKKFNINHAVSFQSDKAQHTYMSQDIEYHRFILGVDEDTYR
ncbi:MAG TPA: hypothetical protein ENH82_19845, partial [bacterium]|nr:hypothetical protein [bacterium]